MQRVAFAFGVSAHDACNEKAGRQSGFIRSPGICRSLLSFAITVGRTVQLNIAARDCRFLDDDLTTRAIWLVTPRLTMRVFSNALFDVHPSGDGRIDRSRLGQGQLDHCPAGLGKVEGNCIGRHYGTSESPVARLRHVVSLDASARSSIDQHRVDTRE